MTIANRTLSWGQYVAALFATLTVFGTVAVLFGVA